LIPQEKSYNAQTISNSSHSIAGSAVTSVLSLGLSGKGQSRQLFIHRDSDTVAFERTPDIKPTLFPADGVATVFGWEFRPVLGRPTVSAGTRQMLAVIAIPTNEQEVPDEVPLQIVTRSYWRRYNSRTQTSSLRWRLLPFGVDGSNTVNSDVQDLLIPNIAKVQQALAPKVGDIKWVNSGADQATVIVKGSNFFSGTNVVIGGTVLREEAGTLVLKSDQAFEFKTSIESLATGDAVLSGRFGASFQLTVPDDKRPVKDLYIARATIRPSRYTKAFRIIIEVRGKNPSGLDEPITLAQMAKLPEPILFIGNEPVPMPYDYEDVDPTLPAPGVQPNNPQFATTKFFRVGAWIPAKSLARSPSVAFRVPFCGSEYQASQPLSFSEPTVTRMGSDGPISVFRIANPLGFSSSVRVELDRTYEEGSPELLKTSDVDFQFKIQSNIVSLYQNLIVRIGTAEPYLLPIPVQAKSKPTIDDSKPVRIKVGDSGPLEWSGTLLDAITGVTLYTTTQAGSAAGAPQQNTRVGQFATYEHGTKIEVYFAPGSTDVIGKAEVEFQIAPGETLRVPLFIVSTP